MVDARSMENMQAWQHPAFLSVHLPRFFKGLNVSIVDEGKDQQ
jgi:hypothetical protein